MLTEKGGPLVLHAWVDQECARNRAWYRWLLVRQDQMHFGNWNLVSVHGIYGIS
jgi:hypothetical protein